MKPPPLAVLSILAVGSHSAGPALPCSAFLLADGGRVLFANNEDYWDPETRVWFVPAKGERHGVMYLGYANGFPQGGLNDAGLAFDGFATAEHPLTEQAGKRTFVGSPIRAAMETCSTVAEVVELLEGIDLAPHLARAMLFFADATGDSVIVEGDAFLRREGPFQAVTNFYQSEHEDDLLQCTRYTAIVGVLEARSKPSIELCERALSAAAQRGERVATLYSNVFDLEARTVRLYLFHDFAHPVELDLAAELAKGAHTLRLPDLFPPSPAFEAFVAARSESVEQRIAKRKGPTPSAEALAACAGTYELELRGETYRVTFRPENGGLLAESPIFDEGHVQLNAESPLVFFVITENGDLTVRFEPDDEGRANALEIEAGGQKARATRVE